MAMVSADPTRNTGRGIKTTEQNVRHTWVINNFRDQLISHAREPTVKQNSPTFSTGSGKTKTVWSLSLIQYGNDNPTYHGYIGIALQLVSGNKYANLRTELKARALDRSGNEVHHYENRCTDTFTNGTGSGTELREFLYGDEMEEVGILSEDGTLTIVVDLTVHREVEIPQIKCTLSEDFGHLFESGELTDVTLVASGGEELKAHKVVLVARSPVFRAMFSHEHMEEQKTSRVVIPDVEAEVLQEMLKFMYIGNSTRLEDAVNDSGDDEDDEDDDSVKMSIALLAAADKYALDNLRSICIECLRFELTPENVAEILRVSDLYSCKRLKTIVLEYMQTHGEEVVKTVEWKSLIVSHPHLIVEVCQWMMAPSLVKDVDEDGSSPAKRAKIDNPNQEE